MPIESETNLIRELIVEEVRIGFRQEAHGTIDGRCLGWPLAASATGARAELSSHCGVGPLVTAGVGILEVVQAALDHSHLGHELRHVFAMPWADLARIRATLSSALMPRVKGAVARLTGRLTLARRCF